MTLEQQFDAAMLDIYRRSIREIGYHPMAFFQMLQKYRGVLTAKMLLATPEASQGYERLYMAGRVDLSLEAVIVEETRFHPLFSEQEIAAARKRLQDHHYEPHIR